MLKKFQNHIVSNFPQLAKYPFFIAVSGGIDSMVLVHLFQHFKYKFGILHCNFKLRGEESEADMQFIHAYCEENNLNLKIGFFETSEIALELKKSIQETARLLRYNWFYEQMEENNVPFVLTAHHLNDSLETFIMNLSRGTGIDGLVGIPETNKQVLRPLLPFSREEIEQYAKENTIQWREDSSNASDKYLRNQIRHSIIPNLLDLNPEFLQSFQKTLQFLKQTQEVAEDGAFYVFSEVTQQREDGLYFNINKVKQLPNSKPYLYFWFKNYGFSAWEDIYNLLDAQSGKQIFSETHILLKDRDALILSEKKKDDFDEIIINSITEKPKFPLKLSLCNQSDISNQSKNVIFVDENKIQFPLTIRKWKDGDYFYPSGMQGKKKVSKYFKDEKFTIFQKQETWILESNNQIVWIIGHRADDRFKIENTTQTILQITYNNEENS